ncbi:MAG: DUF3662 and FHA domain-containing protein [Acidobacteriota bacterium]|nr:DUF3662 and FHA domain-containing protein [Acidobacteriota bacterium]
MRLRKIEAALERALEGAFARVAAGPLPPVEIYRVLWRAVEDGVILSREARYAPNRITIRLNPADAQALAGTREQILGEFTSALEQECDENGWVYGVRVCLRFAEDSSVRQGTASVDCRFDDSPIPAVLEAESGPCAGQRFELMPGAVLGRSPECHVTIPDSAVSRRHCRFDWTLDGYLVSDLDSSNGTFVNDVQVTRYVLQHRDMLLVGTVRLLFAYDFERVWAH